jgi:hypothetical protein
MRSMSCDTNDCARGVAGDRVADAHATAAREGWCAGGAPGGQTYSPSVAPIGGIRLMGAGRRQVYSSS